MSAKPDTWLVACIQTDESYVKRQMREYLFGAVGAKIPPENIEELRKILARPTLSKEGVVTRIRCDAESVTHFVAMEQSRESTFSPDALQTVLEHAQVCMAYCNDLIALSPKLSVDSQMALLQAAAGKYTLLQQFAGVTEKPTLTAA